MQKIKDDLHKKDGISATSNDRIEYEIQKLNLNNPKLAEEYIRCKNAYLFMVTNPDSLWKFADDYLAGDGDFTHTYKDRKYSVSRDYFAEIAQALHVIGADMKIYSGTVGADATIIQLFDLSKINTLQKHEHERSLIREQLGGIALQGYSDLQSAHRHNLGKQIVRALSPERAEIDQLSEQLKSKLIEPSSSPQELVELANSITSGKVFDRSVGVWEGFTLGQHTETCLRAFNENFGEKTPIGASAVAKLAILVHDIGKPIAVQKGDKANQKQYNIHYAKKFLNKIGIDRKMTGLIENIIGEGQDWATEYYVRNNPVYSKFVQFAQRAMQQYTGEQDVRGDDIGGFMELCHMVQFCDSISYTPMAITRDEKLGIFYKNFNERFAKSFRTPIGLTGRKTDFKFGPYPRV